MPKPKPKSGSKSNPAAKPGEAAAAAGAGESKAVPGSTADVAVALAATGAGSSGKAFTEGKDVLAEEINLEPVDFDSIDGLDRMPYPKVAIIFLVNYVYDLYLNNSSAIAAVSDSKVRSKKLALAKSVVNFCISQEYTSLAAFCESISEVLTQAAVENIKLSTGKSSGNFKTFIEVLQNLMATLTADFVAAGCKTCLQEASPAFSSILDDVEIRDYFGMTDTLAEVTAKREGVVLDHLITRYWLVADLEQRWYEGGATDALMARVSDNGEKLRAKVAVIKKAVAELFADRKVYDVRWRSVVEEKLLRMVDTLESANQKVEDKYSSALQSAGHMASSALSAAKHVGTWFASAVSRSGAPKEVAVSGAETMPTRRSLVAILAELRGILTPSTEPEAVAAASAGPGSGPKG